MTTHRDTAVKIVKKFNVLPSQRFEGVVSEVDHAQISAYVRKIRESRNLTAVSVANEMGLTRCQMSLLENGISKWTLSKLSNYVSALVKLHTESGGK